jgi:hypothetical protein
MIINPLNRFSKKELNQAGYKMGFLDSSFLMKYIKSTDIIGYERLVRQFIDLKIKPVVNLILIGELLKGLDPCHPDYQKYFQNKIYIMKFFDAVGAVWVLEHKDILTFELMHLYHGEKNVAHDEFKIFSSSPILTEIDESCERLYQCDKLMNFSYKPCDERCTYESMLNSIILQGLQKFQNAYREGDIKSINAKITILSEIDGKTSDEVEIIRKKMNKQQALSLLEHHMYVDNSTLDKLIDFLSSNINTIKVSAPFWFVEENISCANSQMKCN